MLLHIHSTRDNRLKKAYEEDGDTKFVISKMLKSDYTEWSDTNLNKVNEVYRV